MEKPMDFEKGMQELEALVQGLESGKLSLEDSFKAYERAIALRNALNGILDESDQRIRILTESGERDMTAEDVQ